MKDALLAAADTEDLHTDNLPDGPDPDDPEDDDFSALDSILEAATAKSAEAHRIAALRKAERALSRRGAAAEGDRLALVAQIHALEEQIEWHTTATVALFYSQRCATCGTVSEYFWGWMAEQFHRTTQARRLRAGRPEGLMAERVEIHPQGEVEVCRCCVESVIAINHATGAAL